MINIDKTRIFAEIREKDPKRITLSAPDGLINKVEDLAEEIQREFNIDAFIMGDSCYGSCDTTNNDSKIIGADIAFNIGHTISFEKLGDRTIMIDAFDDIGFENVVKKSVLQLKKYKKIGLVTFSQYIESIQNVKDLYEENGISAEIGKGKGQLRDGQIFGCEFYPVDSIKEDVDAFVVLGRSNFHAISVSLVSDKPTFILDPYSEEIINIQEISEERKKRAILSVYKARDADKFGLIVGLKEGQYMMKQTLSLKTELEKRGKSVRLIAMREVTSDRVSMLRTIDAFIQTSCPRISTDGYTFDKPVLSVPQAEALLNVLDGREPGEFLMKPNWL